MLKQIAHILAILIVILGVFLIIYGALANYYSCVSIGLLLIAMVADELTRFKN